MEAGGPSTSISSKADGKITQAEPTSGVTPNGSVDSCVICLEPITERAITVPCNHYTFDFICLASWLSERPTCPLCNVEVTELQYDWRSPDDYLTYSTKSTREAQAAVNSSSSARGTTTRERGRGRGRSSRWQLPPRRQPTEDEAVSKRRHVYRRNLYSLHVGSNRLSRYREISPQTFAVDADLQSRARRWIRRELQVFRYLDPTNTSSSSGSRSASRSNNAEFLLEYIIAVLKTTDLKDSGGKAEDLLTEFLGRADARLFIHELNAWLRSPYTSLQDWDNHVQYSEQMPGSSNRSRGGAHRDK